MAHPRERRNAGSSDVHSSLQAELHRFFVDGTKKPEKETSSES
jgi:hypothetical protein